MNNEPFTVCCKCALFLFAALAVGDIFQVEWWQAWGVAAGGSFIGEFLKIWAEPTNNE